MPPEITHVTCKSPRESLPLKNQVAIWMLLLGAIWCVSSIMGIHSGYLRLAALIVRTVEMIPYALYRDPKQEIKIVPFKPQPPRRRPEASGRAAVRPVAREKTQNAINKSFFGLRSWTNGWLRNSSMGVAARKRLMISGSIRREVTALPSRVLSRNH